MMDSSDSGWRSGALISIIAAVVLVAGCWNPFSPDTQPGDTLQYYEPLDSAWKVLKNLEFAYISRDIDHYTALLRDDFEFFLLETDWDDYDGDGITDQSWGIDKEEQVHAAMFNNVAAIELTLQGEQEMQWAGDPTGQSLALPRTFDLKVYLDDAHSTGFRASGTALFICRPDSLGEWYIWQWFDQSNI